MTDPTFLGGARSSVGRYEIRVGGHLDDRWADRFPGLTPTRLADGSTLLAGEVVDQAALHGILRTIRDLGLTLLSVTAFPPLT